MDHSLPNPEPSTSHVDTIAERITQRRIHVCNICNKTFSSKSNLTRHLNEHKGKNSFVCKKCGKIFKRNHHLQRHCVGHKTAKQSKKVQKHTNHKCKECCKSFKSKTSLFQHQKNEHARPLKRKATKNYPPAKRSKLNKNYRKSLNVFSTQILKPSEMCGQDLNVCFEELRPELIQLIQQEIEEKGPIKWRITVKTKLSRVRATTDGEHGEDEVQIGTPYFGSKFQEELLTNTVPEHIEQAFIKVKNSFEKFSSNGSGWTLDNILELQLKCAKYAPLPPTSYIPLPKWLQRKKAVVNIKNDDEKCFVWCLIAHKLNLPWNKRPERVSHYKKHEHTIHMGDLKCPIPVYKVPVIENLNNMRINVYGCEENADNTGKCQIIPLYKSERQEKDCISLLLIDDEIRSHYCLIRNMSRLLGGTTKHHGKTFFCDWCLHRFSKEKILTEHQQYCKNHSPQKVKLPDEDKNILEFKNIHYRERVPYVIYADFESIIVSMTPEESSSNGKQEKVDRHEACGYAYIVVGPNGKCIKDVCVYRGPDAATHFVENIIKEKDEISTKLLNIQPMKFSREEEHKFQSTIDCYICHKALGRDKVKDHDHITGLFRGAAHNRCNLQNRLWKTLPVVFHNLKNYDAHHIVRTLGRFQDYEYKVIATSIEKYITFSMTEKRKKKCETVTIQFIDSYQFLTFPLGKLVATLPLEDFKLLASKIAFDQINLLLRKGVYPYGYIDSFEKFQETSLPPRSAFHNSLTDEDITGEDYEHAVNVWSAFNRKNLGDYHDLYVTSDAIQLADVFEHFRSLCLEYYEIDPAHLPTLPALAWQACLKKTAQKLELFTDLDMHLFVENSIRGGISTISTRYATANNRYLAKYKYDPNSPSKYIIYLDANNLYGWAMSQPLPYGGFQWVSPDIATNNWIFSITEDSEEGYILEVDLEYPKELHDTHNDYPLAPEKIKISEDMLSPKAKEILEKLGNRNYHETEKLVPNLWNKVKYVTFYRNLQLYLSLGLKLQKVHKVLKFKQKPWLKTYIDFNTDKRKNATSGFKKDFFKLLNNSVFGKTMENKRKRRNFDLVNDEKKAKKLVASPSFYDFKEITEDLAMIERKKTCITLDRPIYVGFVILELSKLYMYDFHYNHIKQKYGDKAKLLFTDTDSLAYEIQTADIYEDMKENFDLYDTSDYPKNHFLYSTKNKKKIGCFKDELNAKCAVEFVGLRPKMYSLITDDKSMEKKTAKGVPRHITERRLKHEDYKTCLEMMMETRETMLRIGCENHEIFTYSQRKIALSSFDDKRYILEDNVNTYAYGHYKISSKLEK